MWKVGRPTVVVEAADKKGERERRHINVIRQKVTLRAYPAPVFAKCYIWKINLSENIWNVK